MTQIATITTRSFVAFSDLVAEDEQELLWVDWVAQFADTDTVHALAEFQTVYDYMADIHFGYTNNGLHGFPNTVARIEKFREEYGDTILVDMEN